MSSVTVVAVIVHKYNLLQEVGGCSVYDAGDGAKKNCVGLIVKDDHHRCCWKVRRVPPVNTPGRE